MIILLDMDGVLADFDLGVMTEWRYRHPDEPLIPEHERQHFNIDDEHPRYAERIQDIYRASGFFSGLNPIPGSHQGVRDLQRLGHEVFICTAPLFSSPTCMPEKYEWLHRHFDEALARRIIITKDKTLVHGQLLIDDRPEVVGVNQQPTWEHVLYDRAFNRAVNGKRRLNWTNWREVLQL